MVDYSMVHEYICNIITKHWVKGLPLDYPITNVKTYKCKDLANHSEGKGLPLDYPITNVVEDIATSGYEFVHTMSQSCLWIHALTIYKYYSYP